MVSRVWSFVCPGLQGCGGAWGASCGPSCTLRAWCDEPAPAQARRQQQRWQGAVMPRRCDAAALMAVACWPWGWAGRQAGSDSPRVLRGVALQHSVSRCWVLVRGAKTCACSADALHAPRACLCERAIGAAARLCVHAGTAARLGRPDQALVYNTTMRAPDAASTNACSVWRPPSSRAVFLLN